MRTLMTLANDGHDEPSIWATIEWEDSDGSPDDEPICVLQRCDLPMNARPFWPTIVARLVDLEEEHGMARCMNRYQPPELEGQAFICMEPVRHEGFHKNPHGIDWPRS
jgi:hypothetical protein